MVCAEQTVQQPSVSGEVPIAQEPRVPQTARVSSYDAKLLLTACYLAEDFYDMIDCDVFGSDSTCVGPAMDALKFGGLLYLTSTDGFSSAGVVS